MLYCGALLFSLSGFLLPILIARSWPYISDEAFFFLGVVNPLLMFLSMDQTKTILVGKDVDLKKEKSLRIFSVFLILFFSVIYGLIFKAPELMALGFYKVFLLFSEMNVSISERKLNFASALQYRVIEILSLILLFFNARSAGVIPLKEPED